MVQKLEVYNPIVESFMSVAKDWYKLETLGIENVRIETKNVF